MSVPLSVWDIAQHLGVQDWQVSRQCGRENGIPAVKERGAGSVGRGGQWRITRADYLNWLSLPDADRPARGEPLPPVRLLSDVAAEYGVERRRLRCRWRSEVKLGRAWSRGDAILPPSALPQVIDIAKELKKQGYLA